MSGLIPIVARAAGSGALKKIATRVVAGITGAGAKTVAPVYREMGTGSVIKIPKVTDYQQNIVNKQRTMSAQNAKSGKTAKRLGSEREQANMDGMLTRQTSLPKVIKINSNPMRGK